MLNSSFAPIFSTFPAKRLSPPNQLSHTTFHLLRTHRANCSTICLNQTPCHYSPASHFRLHPPPFLPEALSLLRLHNRRSRRCFHPNRRHPRMTNYFQSGYRMGSRTVSDAGYNHYEISSYCKSGYRCKHNLTYWKNKPFYAFGLGSASYVDGVRFSRPKRMKEYTGYVENMENGLVDCGESTRTVQDMATDVVMLSLRTSRGLDSKSFGEAYGSSLVLSLCKAYKPYVESGHVVFLDEQSAADEFNTLLVNKTRLKEVLPTFG